MENNFVPRKKEVYDCQVHFPNEDPWLFIDSVLREGNTQETGYIYHVSIDEDNFPKSPQTSSNLASQQECFENLRKYEVSNFSIYSHSILLEMNAEENKNKKYYMLRWNGEVFVTFYYEEVFKRV